MIGLKVSQNHLQRRRLQYRLFQENLDYHHRLHHRHNRLHNMQYLGHHYYLSLLQMHHRRHHPTLDQDPQQLHFHQANLYHNSDYRHHRHQKRHLKDRCQMNFHHHLLLLPLQEHQMLLYLQYLLPHHLVHHLFHHYQLL